MKSEANKLQEVGKEVTYPKLMRLSDNCNNDGNLIVLFTAKRRGFVVFEDGRITYEIGEFRDNWVEIDFFPYTGSITLSND